MTRPNEQSGFIAIILVIILSLLLVGTTLSAARLNVSALSQSTQVNQSDLSYFAAEAGIQEASRRLDNNPAITDMHQLFPEQYCGTGSAAPLVGDWTDLENADGSPAWTASSGPRIYTEPTGGCSQNQGVSTAAVSWHDRQVYDSGLNPSGTLEKDQTIQIDTTNLCDPTANPQCDPSAAAQTSFHNTLTNVDICITPTSSVAGTTNAEQIELTTASYTVGGGSSLGTPVPVSTYKHVFPTSTASPGYPANYSDADGVTYTEISGGSSGYNICIDAQLGPNRLNQRFIFRPRLILASNLSGGPTQSGNPAITGNQLAITANYKVFLLSSSRASCSSVSAASQCLYVQNDIYFIDVVGQSGSIRRRIVAEKMRNGQLIGIFDFLLYSGDKVIPLCKAGVNTSYNQYNGQCLATTP